MVLLKMRGGNKDMKRNIHLRMSKVPEQLLAGESLKLNLNFVYATTSRISIALDVDI
jgi:hypothetical protein